MCDFTAIRTNTSILTESAQRFIPARVLRRGYYLNEKLPGILPIVEVLQEDPGKVIYEVVIVRQQRP